MTTKKKVSAQATKVIKALSGYCFVYNVNPDGTNGSLVKGWFYCKKRHVEFYSDKKTEAGIMKDIEAQIKKYDASKKKSKATITMVQPY